MRWANLGNTPKETAGDHLHLYVDGERIDVLRQLKDSTELAPMTPGVHHICLAENTKSHVATARRPVSM